MCLYTQEPWIQNYQNHTPNDTIRTNSFLWRKVAPCLDRSCSRSRLRTADPFLPGMEVPSPFNSIQTRYSREQFLLFQSADDYTSDHQEKLAVLTSRYPLSEGLYVHSIDILEAVLETTLPSLQYELSNCSSQLPELEP